MPLATASSSHSARCFPYSEIGAISASTVMGIVNGSPYTAALERERADLGRVLSPWRSAPRTSTERRRSFAGSASAV